jgi:ubiquinone/menaquinone biosynthesis C-methylase UbiE
MDPALNTSERELVEAWSEYQPGFRFTTAPVGSRAFFREIADHRYRLEPHILEMAEFDRWRGRDVLEAGCGIGTDASQFALAGARYTGVDFSPVAIELARKNFGLQGLEGNFWQGSITQMPFPDESFDLVYSNGVLNHLQDPAAAVSEFRRVLRPGGTARVMIYHRNSFNYAFTIMILRRALAPLAFLPRVASVVTGEREEVIAGHRELLREHGLGYLRDRELFLSHNTDGPQNPLSRVWSRDEARQMFAGFSPIQTRVRYLNLRIYPSGSRLAETELGSRLEQRWGWHLWVDARKPAPGAA